MDGSRGSSCLAIEKSRKVFLTSSAFVYIGLIKSNLERPSEYLRGRK